MTARPLTRQELTAQLAALGDLTQRLYTLTGDADLEPGVRAAATAALQLMADISAAAAGAPDLLADIDTRIQTAQKHARHWRRETPILRGAGAYDDAARSELRYLLYDEHAANLQQLRGLLAGEDQ